MVNDTLFEILVYSSTQEEFRAYLVRTLDRTLDKLWGGGGLFLDRGLAVGTHLGRARLKEKMLEEEIQRQNHSIRYTELIGCIEVYSVFTQLRADLWFTEKKRIVMGSRTKPIIRWWDELWAGEYSRSQLTSSEIFKDFRSKLDRVVMQHSRLKRRHIDYKAFDRCGPLVDWRNILRL